MVDRDALKFELVVHGDEDTLDRDRALVAFLNARIAERSKAATAEEKGLLAGLRHSLLEFEEKFQHPHRDDDPHSFFAGQLQALGWSLRCVAFAAFSGHPDLGRTSGRDALARKWGCDRLACCSWSSSTSVTSECAAVAVTYAG